MKYDKMETHVEQLESVSIYMRMDLGSKVGFPKEN
jgi:hypothetical protein